MQTFDQSDIFSFLQNMFPTSSELLKINQERDRWVQSRSSLSDAVELYRFIHHLAQKKTLITVIESLVDQEGQNKLQATMAISNLMFLCQSETVVHRIFRLLLPFPPMLQLFLSRLLHWSKEDLPFSSNGEPQSKLSANESKSLSLPNTNPSSSTQVYPISKLFFSFVRYRILRLGEEYQATTDQKQTVEKWEKERDSFWFSCIRKISDIYAKQTRALYEHNVNGFSNSFLCREIESLTSPILSMILLIFAQNPTNLSPVVLEQEFLTSLLQCSATISTLLLRLLNTRPIPSKKKLPPSLARSFPPEVSASTVPSWLYKENSRIFLEKYWLYIPSFVSFTIWLLHQSSTRSSAFQDARSAFTLLALRLYFLQYMDPSFVCPIVVADPLIRDFLLEHFKDLSLSSPLFDAPLTTNSNSNPISPVFHLSHLMNTYSVSVLICQNPTCPDAQQFVQLFLGNSPRFSKNFSDYTSCHKKNAKVTLSEEQKIQPSLSNIHSMLQRCSKCQLVHYCCKECQTVDWQAHKRTCAATKEAMETFLQKNIFVDAQ